MINGALVLEGGALRGVYVAGVLDVFMENDIEFEYVLGVSARAVNAVNYVSKQIGLEYHIRMEGSPTGIPLKRQRRKDMIKLFLYLQDQKGIMDRPIGCCIQYLKYIIEDIQFW